MGVIDRARQIKEDIENYYFHRLDDLQHSKRMHWLSRHHLWFQDDLSLSLLKNEKSHIFKRTRLGTRRFYRSIYNQQMKKQLDKKKLRKSLDRDREIIKDKYREIVAITLVFFKCLFAWTIFKKDFRPVVRHLFSKTKIMEMREQLLSDHQDLSVLSTPGVNFLYLSEWVYDLNISIRKSIYELPKSIWIKKIPIPLSE